ncbi:hypothetical protein Plim_0992 [Planctopirus limnophila DSM 3776]|uniref:Uncharacterized protein n=1 Tax=Planctopirus limnophila (strain ATCC 43296 / DSM 3776 / IFAM 1008 / Mu 290) TaxID=521674 RepID=D5ST67_PLAL2|nr:hypothetical protein [Planctopirus limnophila]ADG66835.1 hypothetical protein Plim_0992 [Planctopirus limnophila DSM 3776]
MEVRLRTAGVLASELGVPIHRVQYLLKARGIGAKARAGRLRLFDVTALNALREALAESGVANAR